jgi:hypothetical protein
LLRQETICSWIPAPLTSTYKAAADVTQHPRGDRAPTEMD